MRNAAIVRNPLLVLPEVGAAAEMLTDGERTFLIILLRSLSADARTHAEHSWKQKKGASG